MRARTPASTTDLYELTMAAGYWLEGRNDRAVFELFVRRLPADRGVLVASGVESVADYLLNLRFTDDEIAYLRSLPAFASVPEGFYDALAALRFTGDLWAVAEGTPIFPNEPILAVEAPLIEAQLVETALLALVNYPTSVATKAARLVAAARGRDIVEFGARRAHGTDAALIAARSAYIAGCAGTSNVEAGMRFGIPVYGTVAHAWIMSFDDEIEAFRAYQRAFPQNAVLLIDTYDTIRAAHRITETFRPGEIAGVRLDSGDLGDLARRVRAILDEAGFTSTRILASGDLNEWSIGELVSTGAPIDAFGVGTDLTTVRDAPALGVVYKLVEIESGGRTQYKMKLSEGKKTFPGRKQIWRGFEDGRIAGDTVALADEPAPAVGMRPLLSCIVRDGERVGGAPSLDELRTRALASIAEIPAPLLGPNAPSEPYPVRFSDRIHEIEEQLRERFSDENG